MTVKRWIISGQVQGVGYRSWLMREVRPFGVTGWVRNRPDGAVEALVEGPPEALAQLLILCRRGPYWAEVTDIIEEPALPDARTGFGWLALG